ncbi:type II toxin-antitoxin system HicB family antitoxin [Glaciimonas sp. PAMC28666]|uniref:type II toxin-antitoxin system HicB family antitoxin n=1 Tax=Glaciimonas sp. PAMC28666 TaxID=2807626 RepID=UPI0019627A4D|nr:type II toxin-antitoxin system HicB family antitoxin [Glaciimonas sp. PAMC28666]QRX83695.1 type II toxin-antitoxin system HicB family antitoxin [Glaciimonas sp. PAMC28666]
MIYNGYTARIEFDPRDNIFVGRVLGIADIISFHGETVGELTADFYQAVNHYCCRLQAIGRSPEKPASGKRMLRVPPEVHAAASIAAQASGRSLNQWAKEAFARRAHA